MAHIYISPDVVLEKTEGSFHESRGGGEGGSGRIRVGVVNGRGSDPFTVVMIIIAVATTNNAFIILRQVFVTPFESESVG